MPLLRSARRVILLTGTPALNKPKELFPQLACLVPEARLKMKDFGERYCQVCGCGCERRGASSAASRPPAPTHMPIHTPTHAHAHTRTRRATALTATAAPPTWAS